MRCHPGKQHAFLSGAWLPGQRSALRQGCLRLVAIFGAAAGRAHQTRPLPFAAVEISPGFDHAIAPAAFGLIESGIGTSEKLVDALTRSPLGDAEAAGD